MKFETSLKAGTVVSFPGGTLNDRGTVLFVTRLEKDWLLVLDRTSIHPASFHWPDQPADHGSIRFEGGLTAAIIDAQTGFANIETGELLADEDTGSVPRGDETWVSVVLHVVRHDGDDDLGRFLGTTVNVEADPVRRAALSIPHTAVHLAAIALNAVTAGFWTKEFPMVDGLGNPNLDKAAVDASVIEDYVSRDTYRIGKSLRKKGFNRDAFIENLNALETQINDRVKAWVATGAVVTMTPGESLLDEKRQWTCELDGVQVTIPCGGTHVANLSEIGSVAVELAPSEDGFVMTTRAAKA